MTLPRLLACIACAVALAAGTSCGSDEPKTETEQVQDVSDRFNDAFSQGDYGTACDLLHSRRRDALVFEQNESCEDILERSAGQSGGLVEALATAKTTRITITGDSATVDIEGGRLVGAQAILERDGDEWRVTEAAAGL